MKIKIIIGVAVLVVLGVAAFVVTGDGKSATEEQMDRMRGTDAYYAHSVEMVKEDPYGGGEIMTNLMDNKMLKLRFDVKYQIGLDWGDDFGPAQAAFDAAAADIKSELFTRLRAKRSVDLVGLELRVFKEEMIEMIDGIVFPKRYGRVTKFLIKDLIIQG
ncbi:MAG: hypothetical protein H6807_16860 [Planctomycetes bacterium]|nr:hypothetical protein [Planctomycetota bacterium]